MKTPTPEKIIEFRLMMGETPEQAGYKVGLPYMGQKWEDFEDGKVKMIPEYWAFYCACSILFLEEALGVAAAPAIMQGIPDEYKGLLHKMAEDVSWDSPAGKRVRQVVETLTREIRYED